MNLIRQHIRKAYFSYLSAFLLMYGIFGLGGLPALYVCCVVVGVGGLVIKILEGLLSIYMVDTHAEN
jgi:hypothetical protein